MSTLNKLTDLDIRAAIKKAIKTQQDRKLGDGGQLYLKLEPDGDRCRCYWRWAYEFAGKEKTFGIGTHPPVTLAQAREARKKWLPVLKSGQDPVAKRRADEIALANKHAHALEPLATAYFNEIKKDKLDDPRSESWLASLRLHVFKSLGNRAVASIGPDDLYSLLKPLESEIPVTAKRIRARLEEILEHARDGGIVESNAAAVVRHRLEKERKRQHGEPPHHARPAYGFVPQFIRELQEDERTAEVTRLAVEFTIITAARSNEIRGARWSEVDWSERTLTVPASRVKNRRTHIIYLSDRALEILERASLYSDEFVFPLVGNANKPMSSSAMFKFLRRLQPNWTLHGTARGCFSTWAHDRGYREAAIERCLGHVIGSKTARSYNAAELADERRSLLAAWAAYLTAEAQDNVVQLRA